jgi:hypothetical protein
MIGECNCCSGKGQIKASDKPAKVEIVVEDVVSQELINAVADSVPATTIEIKPSPVEPDVLISDSNTDTNQIRIDGKKALYKRKTASK